MAVLLAAPSQDALTITDVVEAGEFSVTTGLGLADGKGKFSNSVAAVDLDFDVEAIELFFDAAIGLGQGFELELSLPYLIESSVEGTGSFAGFPFSLEQESSGFGDLEISPIYRVVKENSETPQWIIGAILVAPTGNDKRGDAETKIGGVTVTEGKEGGNGDGVWRYGLGAAVSKRFGRWEPYAGGTFVLGGDRKRNGVEEDRADVATLIAGTEWHMTPQATIDTSLLFQLVGDDVTEDNGVKSKEEDYVAYGAQMSLYVNLGSRLTLIAGGGILAAGDHEVDTATGTEILDSITYILQVGVHYYFGAPSRSTPAPSRPRR